MLPAHKMLIVFSLVLAPLLACPDFICSPLLRRIMSLSEYSAFGTSDLQFTFVIKEARQYVNLVDATPVLEDGGVRAHQLLPVDEN